jgi:hypothetical protein
VSDPPSEKWNVAGGGCVAPGAGASLDIDSTARSSQRYLRENEPGPSSTAVYLPFIFHQLQYFRCYSIGRSGLGFLPLFEEPVCNDCHRVVVEVFKLLNKHRQHLSVGRRTCSGIQQDGDLLAFCLGAMAEYTMDCRPSPYTIKSWDLRKTVLNASAENNFATYPFLLLVVLNFETRSGSIGSIDLAELCDFTRDILEGVTVSI